MAGGRDGGKEVKSTFAYSRIDSSVLAEGNEGEAEKPSTNRPQQVIWLQRTAD